MKAAIILLLVGVAVAQQGSRPSNRQGFGGGGSGGGGFGGGSGNRFTGRSQPSFRTSGGATGFGGPSFNPCARIERMYAGQRKDYGPKAWGLGLNNPCALPPHPILMDRAIALSNQVPGTLIKVDPNGEIELTDRFGREANVIDVWGRDLTDGLEF